MSDYPAGVVPGGAAPGTPRAAPSSHYGPRRRPLYRNRPAPLRSWIRRALHRAIRDDCRVPRFYGVLHIHSRYSRACSRDCDLEHLTWWAGRKGIGVVGTGDFTHPAWTAELHDNLVPAEPGLFRLKPDLEKAVLEKLPATCQGQPARFLLSVEISTIYKR